MPCSAVIAAVMAPAPASDPHSGMISSLALRYAELLASGAITPNSAQAAAVQKLAALEERLANHRRASKSSSLGWLFGNREKQSRRCKGLYIYGEVGRGKTMLMDLFFDSCRIERKRRVHFHEFMADVHERIHSSASSSRPARSPRGRDPLAAPPSPRRPGCSASTNFTSPTSPTR